VKKEPSKMTAQPILSDIMSNCGIFTEPIDDFCPTEESIASIASPSSIHSEMEQNQELIDELEEFFIKVDGNPTVVDETSEPVSLPATNSSDQILSTLTTVKGVENNNTLTMEDLNNAYTTSLVDDDGQNVIIIIAPSSPADFDSFIEPVSPREFKDPLNSPTVTIESDFSSDTDPDWSPSPASDTSFSTNILSPPKQTIHRKKYARSKRPQPPSGPYPVEKKERKKAQNRTAAFRYREKKKSEQDIIDDELELLTTKNQVLKDKLTEMETEFKYLKKLMTEAGLGRYAQTVKI
jgi:cyclic AMP-dependent transcription factor ATF-4